MWVFIDLKASNIWFNLANTHTHTWNNTNNLYFFIDKFKNKKRNHVLKCNLPGKSTNSATGKNQIWWCVLFCNRKERRFQPWIIITLLLLYCYYVYMHDFFFLVCSFVPSITHTFILTCFPFQSLSHSIFLFVVVVAASLA